MDPKNLFIKNGPLYLITDRRLAGISHAKISLRALSAGVRIIQLREKNLTKKELYQEAVAIRKYSSEFNATFIVNDCIDIAIAVNADGVHLGQEDMPIEEARRILGKKRIIGISTHSLKQAIQAERAGANYIGYGPMFLTKTKNTGYPKGLKSLKRIRKEVIIPIVAIGGITWENIGEVLRNGADAAAVASGILSGNIKENVQRFLNEIKGDIK